MQMIKILLNKRLAENGKKYIADELKDRIGNRFSLVEPQAYDEDEICKEIEDADILLGSFVSKKMLEKAKNLKLIQIPWAGMDDFDFTVMEGYDIPLCNSHSNASAVAEMGVGLTLDIIKKISYHDRKLRRRNWNRDQRPLDLKSGMLMDKTICILGYGQIGRRMGQLLKAFGTRIIAVANSRAQYDEVDEMYGRSQWKMAISEADICVSTLPLTNKTRGQFDSQALKHLKADTIIVNMSRAEIFEEDALYKALKSGQVKGYASDVWWNEPKPGDNIRPVSEQNKFEDLDNVVLSPHRAAFIEGTSIYLDDVVTNIVNLSKGQPLINRVDVLKEY